MSATSMSAVWSAVMADVSTHQPTSPNSRSKGVERLVPVELEPGLGIAPGIAGFADVDAGIENDQPDRSG